MEPTTTQPADLAPAPGATYSVALENEIARWKAQGLKPYAVTVILADGTEAVAFFKKSDRNTIAYALTLTFNKKVLEAGEFILRNTWLGGDERLNPNSAQADDDAIVAAAMEVAQKVDILSASVKKL